jgi:hypothetical protein
LGEELFLLGVPVSFVRAAYLRAPGNEIESGKFGNVESSGDPSYTTFMPNRSAGLVKRVPCLCKIACSTAPRLPLSLRGWPTMKFRLYRAVIRSCWNGGRLSPIR